MNKRIVAGLVALIIGIFAFSACEGQTTSQSEGQKQTEEAFKQQSEAVPYPVDDLQDSLERRNLRERLLRQNDPDRIGYVYFFPFGSDHPLGYWTIKGKVSSTQSQMTTDTIFADAPDDGTREKYPVSAPGDDGSYGENEKGVFFFTTEGAMVQVCEECYFYSDEPVNLGGDLLLLNSK